MSTIEPSTPQDGLAARTAALNLVEAALDHRGGLEEAMDRAPFADLELREGRAPGQNDGDDAAAAARRDRPDA